ncbi:MAG: hypothetical protein R3F34_07155 [Planctomycetota bacterium]
MSSFGPARRAFVAASFALAIVVPGRALLASPASAAAHSDARGAIVPLVHSGQDDGAGQTKSRTPLRYVQARSGGATVRNLADVQGLPLVDVPTNGLLAVYGESAGWLEVDVPGGLPVWVSGRYVGEVEGAPGVLEVTRNNVLMRPRAGTDVNNFPLGLRLFAGDQVAEISREDAAVPLAETWVRIWAPPGACGYVQADRTAPLAQGENGVDRWAREEKALAASATPSGRGAVPKNEASVREAAAPTSERATLVQAALDKVDERFESERLRAVPDFDGLRDAYRGVLALEGGDAFASSVTQKLERVDALEEIHRTRALLEEERVERQRERERRQREQWERLRERDPFYGRFAVRGVLERFQDSRGARTYRVTRGGDPQAVLRCTSERYDLEVFVGREIGLDGGFVVVEEASLPLDPSISAFVRDLPVLDVATIEVLR